jgi:hypothetical protein
MILGGTSFVIGYLLRDGTGLSLVLESIGLGGGLTIASLADIDMNYHGRVRKGSNLILVALIGMAGFLSFIYREWAIALAVLPPLLGIILGPDRFKRTLVGAIWFCTLQIGFSVWVFRESRAGSYAWIFKAFGVMSMLWACVALLFYFRPPWKTKSESEACNIVMRSFNFWLGTFLVVLSLTSRFLLHDVTSRVYQHFGDSSNQWPALAFFAGPIQLMPLIVTSVFFTRLYGILGVRWLKQRLAAADPDDTMLLGNSELVLNVDAAIAADADLNARTWVTPLDSYTLLIRASFAGDLSAVRRLLGTRGVDPNVGSGQRTWTALFVCARSNRCKCATSLISHGADVNKASHDGLTPLFIAAARGHVDMIHLLRNNGAEDAPGWMGLSASEAAAHGSRKSQRAVLLQTLRAYESEFQGNVILRNGGKST